MAGLQYDDDDLYAPNKIVAVNRVFEAIHETPVVYSNDVAGTSIRKDSQNGSLSNENKGSEAALVSDVDPLTTNRKYSEKLFADTRQLDECIAQAENLQDVLHSDAMALKVVGILSFGLRKSGELLADAIYRHKIAKSDAKRAQAYAALEHFGEYMRKKKDDGLDIKSTDNTRGHYINIDSDVVKAVEQEAFYEAVVSQLDTYKTQFTMVMSAVKAMIGKGRGDAMISGVATPTASYTDGVL